MMAVNDGIMGENEHIQSTFKKKKKKKKNGMKINSLNEYKNVLTYPNHVFLNMCGKTYSLKENDYDKTHSDSDFKEMDNSMIDEYHEYTKEATCSDNLDQLTQALDGKEAIHIAPEIHPFVRVIEEESSLDKIINRKVPWAGYSPLHSITSGKQTEDLAKLIDLGYVRKTGKWMPEEIEQLNQNMDEFIRDHDIKDFKSLIRNRTNNDKMFRRKTQFILKVSKGISRAGYDVGNRLYTQFATFVQKGRYSKEEMAELKRLHNLYGNKWKEIGLHLNRSHWGMSDIFHNGISKKWNKGPWSLEEMNALLESVVGYFERNEPVSWKGVCRDVKTRSSVYCRTFWCQRFSQIRTRDAFKKWQSNCQKDENNIDRFSFSNKDILKFVTLISDANIDDEYLIDWNDFVKHFDHVTSPAWLKWKFQAVCKEVPHSHRLDFEDLLEQLIELYDKKIQENLGEDLQVVDG